MVEIVLYFIFEYVLTQPVIVSYLLIGIVFANGANKSIYLRTCDTRTDTFFFYLSSTLLWGMFIFNKEERINAFKGLGGISKRYFCNKCGGYVEGVKHAGCGYYAFDLDELKYDIEATFSKKLLRD